MDKILYEKRGPIAYVTLNRPDKLNALSDDIQLEVREALEDAGWGDDAIRVINSRLPDERSAPGSTYQRTRPEMQLISARYF